MSEPEKPLYDSSKMEYRYLGDSGLRVSVLSFGVMMHDNVENLKEILKICLNNGVNFFDTAEVYGMGVAEKTFGQAIQSLKNLQLDYCDIVFAHRYDRDTPIEETVRAMNYLIEKGLTFYWATSEWTPDQIERAFNIAKDRNLIPPICDQAHYNLVYREIVDSQYRDLFRFRKYGITAWSPLEGGILTGKYMDNKIPEGSRISSGRGRLPATWEKNKADWEPKFVKLQKLAKEKLDCTLTQLSIAWCIKNTDVSTAILGAMNPDQIKEDLKALEVSKKLTKEILEEIETIMKNAPKGEVAYFKGFGPMPIRRNIQEGINKTEF